MDLEQKAIERLKFASDMSLRVYKQPLMITYSGGKDSDTLLHLTEASGIPFEVLHSLTTADAPQTIHHVMDTFKRLENEGIKCEIDKHKSVDANGNVSYTTMWNLIPRKLMPPTRVARYCCSELKENGGKGRFIATGVRWDESQKRKMGRAIMEVQHKEREKRITLNNDNDEERMLFETCTMKGKRMVNPIIDWKDRDIWDYIGAEHIKMNPLYQCGYKRIGCIGCPMAGKSRVHEFRDFPKFKVMYIHAFDRMLKRRESLGKEMGGWTSGVDVYHWWMEDGVLPGQTVLFEEETYEQID